jgi:hypothetical protein
MERGPWEDRRQGKGETVPLNAQSRRSNKRRATSYESLNRGTPDTEEAPSLGPDDSTKFEPVVVGLNMGPASLRSCLLLEPLLLATLLGVACGIGLGLLLKLIHPSQQSIALIGGRLSGSCGLVRYPFAVHTMQVLTDRWTQVRTRLVNRGSR